MKYKFTILFLLCSLALQAQEKDVELHDVSVVANRKLKDIGIEKTTLDTLVLHDNISLSMGDILSKNSTLFIKSYGRATESTAEFRGTSPSHTQVLWNGLRINSPMLGTVDFSTIPAYFIDETNLYHGASSVNLSGGGLGGAVEMLTRAPQPPKGVCRPVGVQYVQGVGSYNTFDQFLRVTYAKGRWATSTRLVYSTSKNQYKYTNYDKMVDERDEAGNIINSYHPEETNKSGYFDDVHALQEVYYDAGKGNRLGLNVWYSYSRRGLPFLSVDYKDDTDFKNEHKANTLRSVLSWDQVKEAYKLAVKGGYEYSDGNYDYYTTRQAVQTNITSSESRTHTAFVRGDLDWYFRPTLMFSFGTSAYYNHVKSSDKSPFHIGDNFDMGRMDADANVQVRWRPFPVFSLAGVVREEVHGSDFVPPIPAVFADLILYKPWNLVLKASAARNYRYPSMDDLYFQPGGNPDLRPEKGFTYDGGIEIGPLTPKGGRHAHGGQGVEESGTHTPLGNWGASITFFDSYINDWILWTPNAKGYWQPSNVKKVHNYGIEATLKGEVRIAKDWKLSLTANFAWTPSKNMGEPSTAGDASYGKQLCYVPERSANINARLQWKTWTLTYQWTHYSERYTTTSNEVDYITGRLKPYYMHDASIEKNFSLRLSSSVSRPSSIDFSLKAAVNNLFSTEYVTVLSHPMPRRNFEIYLTIKL